MLRKCCTFFKNKTLSILCVAQFVNILLVVHLVSPHSFSFFQRFQNFIDSVFIVRKKPLIFLHWYHRVTLLLFCWNVYVDEASDGLYFVSMNYTVHTVMYFFFLLIVRMVPKWFSSWFITLMKIPQMMIGTFIVGITMYYSHYGGRLYKLGECSITDLSMWTGGIIYASNLYLFVEFTVKRFIFGIKEDGEGKKKDKTKIA